VVGDISLAVKESLGESPYLYQRPTAAIDRSEPVDEPVSGSISVSREPKQITIPFELTEMDLSDFIKGYVLTTLGSTPVRLIGVGTEEQADVGGLLHLVGNQLESLRIHVGRGEGKLRGFGEIGPEALE
jgi:hypothetical protein